MIAFFAIIIVGVLGLLTRDERRDRIKLTSSTPREYRRRVYEYLLEVRRPQQLKRWNRGIRFDGTPVRTALTPRCHSWDLDG